MISPLPPNHWSARSHNTKAEQSHAGTYGTNGFKLEFDSASTTAALGTDSSGNGHTWTVNGFSVANDATKDSMQDHPGVNYATWNPIDANLVTASNGNLTANTPATSNQIRATIGMSTGKWYWEVTPTSANGDRVMMGIVDGASPNNVWPGFNTQGWVYNGFDGNIFYNNSNTPFGNTWIGDFGMSVVGAGIWFRVGSARRCRPKIAQASHFARPTGRGV